jgi:hypothetical protein
VRKSGLLAELTGVMPDAVAQDLYILSIGVDNNYFENMQHFLSKKAVWISSNTTR